MFQIQQKCDGCDVTRDVTFADLSHPENREVIAFDLFDSVRNSNGWAPVGNRDVCGSCLIKIFTPK